jgi:hypothetical protein
MTGKERILCTLAGSIPDRVPVTIFVQEEYLSYHYRKNNPDRVKDAVILAAELGFDLMTRQRVHEEPHYTRRSFPNWQISKREEIAENNIHRHLEIETPGGRLSQIESAPYNPAIVEGIHFITSKFMIRTPEDFELFRKYMPPLDRDYVQEMKAAALDARKHIGDLGISCPWGTGGVYNTAARLRDISQLCIDPFEDENFYHELMEFLTSILERDYDLLAGTAHECIGIQGNIANGRLVGSDFFRKYIQPYEKRLIDAVKGKGKYTLYHNCGSARNLYENYRELGMTVWETISPPPQGDNEIAEAKKLLGKDLVLSGNLDQIHFLKEANAGEVKDAVEKLMALCKPGGKYLFDTSDYLEPNTPLENIKAMIQAAISCGEY